MCGITSGLTVQTPAGRTVPLSAGLLPPPPAPPYQPPGPRTPVEALSGDRPVTDVGLVAAVFVERWGVCAPATWNTGRVAVGVWLCGEAPLGPYRSRSSRRPPRSCRALTRTDAPKRETPGCSSQKVLLVAASDVERHPAAGSGSPGLVAASPIDAHIWQLRRVAHH